jgi:hypothetical protein
MLDGERSQMRIGYEIGVDAGLAERFIEHSNVALGWLRNPDGIAR